MRGVFRAAGCTALLLIALLLFAHGRAGADVGVEIGVGDTLVQITGQTSPDAFVTIRDDDSVIGTAVADGTGHFVKLIGAQTPGIHSLSLYAKSSAGTISDSLQLVASIRAHETTSAFVFLPTTIALAGSEFSPGSEVAAHGETIPNGVVQIFIDQLDPIQVSAGSDGLWELHVGPDKLTVGNHSIAAYVADGSGQQSAPTVPRFFTILASPDQPLPTSSQPDQAVVAKPLRIPSINLPQDNAVTTAGQITVVGLSDAYAQIEVWRNSRIVGSVFADKHGGWFLTIPLQTGMNEITSRACNGSQCSRFSQTLHVIYAPAEALLPSLRLQLDTYRFDTGTGQKVHLKPLISGGQQPYSYQIDWGDGTNQQLALPDSQTIFSHAYAKPGRYSGTIIVQDAAGAVDQNSFSVTVRGSTLLYIIWKLIVPMLAILALLLIILHQARTHPAVGSVQVVIRQRRRRSK